ncbi:MAG TPA: hypothetical protein VFA23_02285 [Dongiaceae bacterium]|nr:hypothetical protein [Dongiaceae bacterium]
MRVSPWLYLALILPLGLPAGTARAQEDGARCKASTTSVITSVMRATPDVQVFEFRGIDAKLGIKLYNALPPQGHEHGDRFYILMKPGAAISHLIVGDAGCLQDAATVDRGTAGVIKKVIERTAAATSI